MTSIETVIFSPDGKELIAGTDQGMLFSWDVRSGMIGRQQVIHYTPNSLSFDRLGTYLVASMSPGPVHIWSYPSGTLLYSFETDDLVSNDPAVISPDGRVILTTDELNDSHLWPFPSLQELIDITREKYKLYPLTKEERKQFFLD